MLASAADYMPAVAASVMKAAERRPHAEKITSRDWRMRFGALRSFYKMAQQEIESAGSQEWGIDPYEVQWLKVFTPIEYALWHDIRAADAVLYPQYPVGRFFVDFANPVAKVAIECDGAAYHTDKQKDATRQREIERMGWSMYRLTGRECKTDFDEENMERGAARKLIDYIVKLHGISRNNILTMGASL